MGAFIACFIPAISKPEPPHAIFPQARFLARHCDGKIHALKARPALRLGEKRVDVEIAFGIVRDCCIGCAREANAAGERAGVYARQANAVVGLHTLINRLDITEIAWLYRERVGSGKWVYVRVGSSGGR